MYRIVFSRTASDDLHTIYDYIASDSPLYADRVIDKIILVVSSLTIFPCLGQSTDDENLREIVEPRYGFRIVYRITGKTVSILAVFRYRDR